QASRWSEPDAHAAALGVKVGAVDSTLTARSPKIAYSFARKVTRALFAAQTGMRTVCGRSRVTSTVVRRCSPYWKVRWLERRKRVVASRIESQPDTGRPGA